jgi:hypothetical protein
MSSKIFKVSAIAMTIASSFSAQAALYNVYMDAPIDPGTENPINKDIVIQTYGVAISPSSTDCWTDVNEINNPGVDCNASQGNDFSIASEVKQYREGWNYRDQVPFFAPFGHIYFEDGDYYDGFDRYCQSYIGYADRLCQEWAVQQYSQGYYHEVIAKNYNGSLTYVDGVELYSENSVINSIDSSGLAAGTRYDGTVRSRGFATTDGVAVSDLSLTDVGNDPETYVKSHVSKTLVVGTDYITVGSVAKAYDSVSDNSYGAVWLNGALQEPVSWIGGTPSADGDYRSHADIRDAVTLADGNVYGVGYNSQTIDSTIRFKAGIFQFDPTDSYSVTTKTVGGFGDESTYINQVLESVNENGKAIGSYKLNTPRSGSYTNGLFYVDDVSANSPSLSAFSGDIFFSDANGYAGAINNHNDVVGTIDYERHQEKDGKPRATRAFIANIGDTVGSAPIAGTARYLDDLTAGDNAIADNNQYRIIEAKDINDAGVIAATALYCEGGYSSNAINATCGQDLTIVGVKLVPINGADETQIQPRSVIVETVERQGAGFGLWTLTLLGLLGFRRK